MADNLKYLKGLEKRDSCLCVDTNIRTTALKAEIIAAKMMA